MLLRASGIESYPHADIATEVARMCIILKGRCMWLSIAMLALIGISVGVSFEVT
jgi:hypothetical protein